MRQLNDKAAKAATNLQIPPDLKMNSCDLKSKIKKSMGTKNLSIKVFNRRAPVVITRMRIGHTHLTHSYHMYLKPPRCDNCDTTLTVPHILYDWGLFGAARAKYAIDATSLGNDVEKNENLLYFLKDIGVINLI
jgi:hypothetical protein